MTQRKYALTALVWLAILGCTPALAERNCAQASEHCVAVGTWEVQMALGAGVRTNPLLDSDDIPLVVIPQVSYYGKRLFLENLELGYTLVETPELMINALITPNGDGLFFFRDGLSRFVLDGGFGGPVVSTPPPGGDRHGDFAEPPLLEHNGNGGDSPVSPPLFSLGYPDLRPGFESQANQNPGLPVAAPTPNLQQLSATTPLSSTDQEQPKLHSRRVAGMAGLEISGALGPMEWQTKLLQDVTGVHQGWTARVALGTETWLGTHNIGATVGLDWKSDKLLDYYYGVAADEAGGRFPAYRAEGGATAFARLRWRKQINNNWYWLGAVQHEHLSTEIYRSPLVEDRGVTQIFLGVVYRF